MALPPFATLTSATHCTPELTEIPETAGLFVARDACNHALSAFQVPAKSSLEAVCVNSKESSQTILLELLNTEINHSEKELQLSFGPLVGDTLQPKENLFDEQIR